MFEELLKKSGLTRDTLNYMERETLERWATQMSGQTVGIREVQEYISSMISGVERELAGYETPASFTAWLFRGKRTRYLKARLYNYIMLRDFLTAPDKARSFVEKHITNLKK